MKISDLFKVKGFPVVIVTISTITFILSCTVLLFIPQAFDSLCLETRPDYVWQYFSGIFIHNIEPEWVMWVHMIMNFMALIPFGIIVEKIIGSKHALILFLIEWIVTAICFQLVTWNNPGQACGISTIEYAFATVGFYCIYIVLKSGKVSFYRQPLFYYFLFELFGMLGMLNPMSSMTSFVLHISGVVVGIAYIVFKKKAIRTGIEQMNSKE